MALALYRRYRPDTFAGVIGQDQVTVPLMRALDEGKLTHAYLFSGPRGCGKTSSARILARCINCAQGPTSHPCGECESCRDLATGGPGSIDVVEIDAASHNGVDDARELRERAGFAPARDRYKIFILDEAHMVTQQGFNALLKIVEEPPEHVMFIFATTEPDKVIGTIRSRTHHYPFRLVPAEVMGPYLEDVCAKEGVTPEPGVLRLAMRAGGGSMRDTLSVLDQLMVGAVDGTITHDASVALLGFTPDALIGDAVDAVIDRDGAALYAVVQKVVVGGFDPRRFVEDLLARVRDLLVLTLAGDRAESVLSDGAEAEDTSDLQRQASALGLAELTSMAETINTTLGSMTGAISPRMRLELLAARLLAARETGAAGAAGGSGVAGPSGSAGSAGSSGTFGQSGSFGPASSTGLTGGQPGTTASGGFAGASAGSFAANRQTSGGFSGSQPSAGGFAGAASQSASSGFAASAGAGAAGSTMSGLAGAAAASAGSASGSSRASSGGFAGAVAAAVAAASAGAAGDDSDDGFGAGPASGVAAASSSPQTVAAAPAQSAAASVAQSSAASPVQSVAAPAPADDRTPDQRWDALVAALPEDVRRHIDRSRVPKILLAPDKHHPGRQCVWMKFDRALSKYAFALAVSQEPVDGTTQVVQIVRNEVHRVFGPTVAIAPTDKLADGSIAPPFSKLPPDEQQRVKSQLLQESLQAAVAKTSSGSSASSSSNASAASGSSDAAGSAAASSTSDAASADDDDVHRAAASSPAGDPWASSAAPAPSSATAASDDPWATPASAAEAGSSGSSEPSANPPAGNAAPVSDDPWATPAASAPTSSRPSGSGAASPSDDDPWASPAAASRSSAAPSVPSPAGPQGVSSPSHPAKHVAVPDPSDTVDPWAVSASSPAPQPAPTHQQQPSVNQSAMPADPWMQVPPPDDDPWESSQPIPSFHAPQQSSPMPSQPQSRPFGQRSGMPSSGGPGFPGGQPGGPGFAGGPANADPWRQSQPFGGPMNPAGPGMPGGPNAPTTPQVDPDEDEYSMSDESLGTAGTMSVDELKKFFDVKKVEEFKADDPKNPRNLAKSHRHDD
ncbi:DNA polymerase III subunit gamma/tau [Bifidobacterium samirii]|uniref:DNA-directed DNA polymerase n=1 Tax=Bifidobacterium samirii TaxID=2306974 RepID=A0A430FP60_9BIFI|nr:DNA polymerase III subunit gamma and tau [Bifidobacterium samirii]RSX54617.1 DNA polymerase III subunit gamma/tau [Bifidobacterium samirii]